MFNSSLKKESIEKFEEEIAICEKKYEIMETRSSTLHEIRQKSISTIKCVEDYINTLKNTPESFKVDVKEVKVDVNNYEEMLNDLEKEILDAQIKAGGGIASGVAAGVGFAAAAPAAAMGIATTFGVASTGTAISALSGAAATNAALAWLGGGALAAGGGGIGLGSTFLALAGPVGWTIAAGSAVGAGLFMNGKNKKVAEEAMKKTKEVVKQNKILEVINYEIKEMISYTRENNKNIELRLELTEAYPTDYLEMNEEQRYMLGTLLNLVKSAVVSLNAYIGDDNKFKIKKKTTRDTDFFASI